MRRIYRRYLEGCSEGQIQRELTQDGIATAKGVKAWSHQIVHNILTNEKYAGDALLLKDLHHRLHQQEGQEEYRRVAAVLHQGQPPCYHPAGHLPAGYRRRWHGGPASERFCRKAEKQNRASIPPSMRSVSGWSVGSVVPPISGVPGPGTGVKRIVWRCVSRLEFGKKYCHNSPSVAEDKLHTAILTVLNRVVEASDGLQDELAETLRMVCTPEGGR